MQACSLGFTKELQQEFGVPVIDCMIASLKQAEYLLELREKGGVALQQKEDCTKRPDPEEMRDWQLDECFNLEGLLD